MRNLGGLILTLVLLNFHSLANAQDRVALLIGNADYQHERLLKNPRSDAKAMADTLSALGFEVTTKFDLDERSFADALSDFQDAAADASISVVYYSGHGLEIDGTNYIIPVDARLRRSTDAKLQAVSLDHVLEITSGAKQLSLIILDACRNNLFGDGKGGEFGGMSKADPLAGQVIAYSTSPNSIAFESEGLLSPYTQALIERLNTNPSEDIRIMLSSLSEKTQEYAGRAQVPYVEIGSFPEGQISLAHNETSENEPPSNSPEKECDICPEMVVLEGGTYLRGAPDDDHERSGGERPQSEVSVAPFAIAKTETTVAQFRAFAEVSGLPEKKCWVAVKNDWVGREDVSWDKPIYNQSDDHPVACVSYEDAQKYIDWLNEQTDGPSYRLPSETEWEFAARAGTTTSYFTGTDISSEKANFLTTSSQELDPTKVGTVAVGDLGAENAWGLRHMLGNVYEWTADCFVENYENARSDSTPIEKEGCDIHPLRGGSMVDEKWGIAVTWRYGKKAYDRMFMIGFRVARDLE